MTKTYFTMGVAGLALALAGGVLARGEMGKAEAAVVARESESRRTHS